MVGTFAADEAMFGGAALARERPFLERRLRMLGRRELPFDHVAPVASDEGARGLFAPVEPQRADQPLDHVGGDIVALSPTVAHRLPADPAMGPEVEVPRDPPPGPTRGATVNAHTARKHSA